MSQYLSCGSACCPELGHLRNRYPSISRFSGKVLEIEEGPDDEQAPTHLRSSFSTSSLSSEISLLTVSGISRSFSVKDFQNAHLQQAQDSLGLFCLLISFLS